MPPSRCGPRPSRPAPAAGARREERSTASVGNERVGEQDRAGGAVEVRQPGDARALLELLDVGVERCHSPSPSEAAHTATAVPSSTSRASEITPPAPQPTSFSAERLVDALERRLGRREVGAGREHDASRRGRP